MRMMKWLMMSGVALLLLSASLWGSQYGTQPNAQSSSSQSGTQAGQTAETKKHHKKSKAAGEEGKTGSEMQGNTPEWARNAHFAARLMDESKQAQEGAAMISVKVSGVRLVDPPMEGDQAKPGEAHIHYQLDNGPIVATTAGRLDFHGLTPGEHTIKVGLAAGNHQMLGPEQTLSVTIPESAAAHR